MKITEFLKKYSLIENEFIDDFYTFYNDGKNEYDFTINLELVAKWLNTRKDHLKKLLKSNFTNGIDFTESKVNGLKGTGTNNRIDILLTYNCSKLLCMISKSTKANIIRNFYIELEKLIITYKDNIVNDLNRQLGVNNTNAQIIENNNKEGLLYILKVDDETDKIGSTYELKKRMESYNVGRINQLPIVYVYKCKNIEQVENCVKKNLEEYRFKKHKNNELFKVDDEFIKDTITYCNKRTLKIKENVKLLNSKTSANWLIIIDTSSSDISHLYEPIKTYVRKKIIKNKKPSSKKPSKIINKKINSKKSLKIINKKKSKKRPQKNANKKSSKKTKKM